MTKPRRNLYLLVLLAGLGTWAVLLLVEWRNRPDRDPNYTEIDKGLWLGGHVKEPPPGTTAVLNLCEWDDPYKCDAHLWKHIKDAAPAPNLEWLADMVRFVETHRTQGKTVYIHCLAGISRGGMVTTAYLMKRDGLTRDQALALIRQKRPIRPNEAFMELLLEWEKSLKAAFP